MSSKMMRALGFGLLYVFFAVACSGPETREPEAARALSLARDTEAELDRLDEAIEAYRKVSTDFSGTPSGKKAGERVEQLSAITGMIDGFRTAEEDSLPSVCGAILSLAPNYEPVLFRLGHHYADRSGIYARMASTWKDRSMAGRLTRVWTFQDSLWSGYSFRPTHKDREMRDILARHAVEMARMMQGQKRWEEAENLIDRGLEYGSGKDILAQARVYGSFYKFRNGNSDDAYKMAGEALEHEELEDKLQAQAHHVRGLVMTYRYQDHKEIADLDQAIKSLNEAVGLDPGMGDARSLLRELRKTRGKLQAS